MSTIRTKLAYVFVLRPQKWKSVPSVLTDHISKYRCALAWSRNFEISHKWFGCEWIGMSWLGREYLGHQCFSDECLGRECFGLWDANVLDWMSWMRLSRMRMDQMQEMLLAIEYCVLPKYCTDSKCVPEIMKCFKSTQCHVFRESAALEVLHQSHGYSCRGLPSCDGK